MSVCFSSSCNQSTGNNNDPDSDVPTDVDSEIAVGSELDTDTSSNTDAVTDSAGDTDADTDADTDIDIDTDTGAHTTDTDFDTHSEVDADTDVDMDTDSDVDTDADADTDVDADSDSDTTTGTDLDFEADTDTGTGAHADSDTDTRTAADTDTETAADSNSVSPWDTENPASVEHVETSTGVDWRLPDDVLPAANSGAFYIDSWPDRDTVRFAGITVSWAEMNPSEGVYDFSQLQSVLTQAESRNTPLIIRLKCHVVDRGTPADWGGPDLPYVPQWVLDKYNPPEFYTTGSQDEVRFIKVAAPWDAGLQQELELFIEAFGQQGFFDDPALRGIYITGFSSSFGEEFWLNRNYLENALDAGMTEAAIRETYQARIDWWIAAADTNIRKLIWIDYGNIQAAGYSLDDLDDYALTRGLGWRCGGPDTYHSPLPDEVEQSYDAATGYITTDWSYPLRDGLRYFGGEIEVAFRESISELTQEEQTHLTESAIMRTTQIGMNYVWTSPGFVDYSPDMFEWWTKIAGKNAQTTPEAICWLRQDGMRLSSNDYYWNNFELFLTQREEDGAMTRPVLPISRPASLFWQDIPDMHFDYSARATDLGTGNDKMLFYLDDEYKTNLEAPFEIKVVYLDDTNSRWVLEVPDGVDYERSSEVPGEGDNNWKTATFVVNVLPDSSSSQDDSDFRIRVVNAEDVTIKFVRVIK